VNLIGEHTDYNEGLALPFAIAEGIRVRAQASGESFRAQAGGKALRTQASSKARIHARALSYDEVDDFPLADPPRTTGWRAFVRGIAAELGRCQPLVGAHLSIDGTLPQGAGLSSSAALEVAVCLALIALRPATTLSPEDTLNPETTLTTGKAQDRLALARLCARVEREWAGARTGLLDQLACLYGEVDSALLIDFRSLSIQPVALKLGDWRLVVLDSGERHEHADSGYNERRSECARACELLGVRSLREIEGQRLREIEGRRDALATLPATLRRRVEHVIGENERVRAAAAALSAGDLPRLGELLNASHTSLRDLYEVSTPAVERALEQLRAAGAAGARLVGGGFGGSVLGLFAPSAHPPAEAREVRPARGAYLLAP
jgi:galactokinase